MNIEWQRAAAYVVVFDGQDQILLTRFEVEGHVDSGAWTLPGGGMEWNEQAHETASRELMEETGLTGQLGPLLGTHSKWYTAEQSALGQTGHALRLIFAAADCTGTLKEDFSDDNSTVAAGWFTLEEVTRLYRVPLVDFGIGLAAGSGSNS